MNLSQLFQPEARTRTEAHKRTYAIYELWYTAVDVSAAVCFVVGSVLFFSEQTQTAATWFFVVGSICFLMKPILRLKRELRFIALGDVTSLADRAGWAEDDKMAGGHEGPARS